MINDPDIAQIQFTGQSARILGNDLPFSEGRVSIGKFTDDNLYLSISRHDLPAPRKLAWQHRLGLWLLRRCGGIR